MKPTFVAFIVVCSVLSGCSSLSDESLQSVESSFEEMSDWITRRLPDWMMEPSQADKDKASLLTAGPVDLDRYLGTWYEIASLPFWGQEGCVATTVTYRKVRTGGLAIVTRCLDQSFRGEERVSRLDARVDPEQPDGSRLLVNFIPFVDDSYWILSVDPDYRWALVGSPDRQHLWVLARHPYLAHDIYRQLVAQAAQQGYPVDELYETVHPPLALVEQEYKGTADVPATEANSPVTEESDGS